MDQVKTGRFLKEMRKKKGLTQEQLAEKLGVSNRSVSRWENGKNMPDFDLIIELANLYDVGIEEILSGERENNMTDKEKEKAMLRVSEYESNEKMHFVRRLRIILIIALIFHSACTMIQWSGVGNEEARSFLTGAVFGLLALSVLVTTRYSAKIRALKLRLLKRQAEPAPNSRQAELAGMSHTELR